MIGHHTAPKSVKYPRQPKHPTGPVCTDLSGMSVDTGQNFQPQVINPQHTACTTPTFLQPFHHSPYTPPTSSSTPITANAPPSTRARPRTSRPTVTERQTTDPTTRGARLPASAVDTSQPRKISREQIRATRTAPHRTAPHRTAPHRTAPHRTAPHRTAPHRTAPAD
ncbi:hypothetical protein GCM10018962_91690 [Dactylosporangium matsuzakiense]